MLTINQYQFAYLKHADQSFKKEDRCFLQKLENPENLFIELDKVMTDEETVGFDMDQRFLMLERIQILKAIVEQEKSIKYLGSIKYAADFDRAKRELS